MITVHHLNEFRSQRILWHLEELEVPYDIQFCFRDPHTKMAPTELQRVRPLGKSPVITEEGRAIAESGAIIDYIVRRYADGRRRPDPAIIDYDEYVHWLHYAEGSASLPLIMLPIANSFGKMATPLLRRMDYELELNLGYINERLQGREFLLGSALTAADVQLSFVGELAVNFANVSKFPALAAWLARFQARPAYKAAIERGGPYGLAHE